MLEQDVAYIKENYLTIDQLSEQSNVSKNDIQSLINRKLLPDASYTIKETIAITSSLNDEIADVKTISYYAKSSIIIIRQIIEGGLQEVQTSFKANLKSHLEQHQNKEFAYNNVFNQEGQLMDEKFEEAANEEWTYFLNGVYGICTFNGNEEEIIKKEIAVKKLINYTRDKNSSLNDTEKKEFVELVREYDAVSRLFAPYQRATSSRGKYVDSILEKNNLSDHIKSYT